MNLIKSVFWYNRLQIIILILLLTLGCSGSKKESDEKKIITAEEWGSIPVTDTTTETHHIQRVTIHHGGVYFDPDKDVREYLRHLQQWSREEKGWIDIPYHYLMDMDGLLYEGRPVQYPGDTNTDYDPRGHLLICIIGNYEKQKFKSVQYENLVYWLGYFCRLYNLPADSIRGHRDYTETLCPGKNIYKFLKSGRLVSDVKKVLNKN